MKFIVGEISWEGRKVSGYRMCAKETRKEMGEGYNENGKEIGDVEEINS